MVIRSGTRNPGNTNRENMLKVVATAPGIMKRTIEVTGVIPTGIIQVVETRTTAGTTGIHTGAAREATTTVTAMTGGMHQTDTRDHTDTIRQTDGTADPPDMIVNMADTAHITLPTVLGFTTGLTMIGITFADTIMATTGTKPLIFEPRNIESMKESFLSEVMLLPLR
jgi:hypothetical protein|tara:strand:- start:32 stop:535 length:504 start_codon:yes stop_codon:yes gene_type:complete